ncbi:tRNA pseudouridine(13) synthase TruD [archaeon]|nr:tRNA pseudouridine(13) synthase TruD [archaeon]
MNYNIDDYLPILSNNNPKAKIKEIPDDFLVEEIDLNGDVLEIGKKYVFDNKKSGDFFIFVLEKNDIDTFMAIRSIAYKLGISKDKITVAGMKDKKAITAQKASAHKMKKEQFEKLIIPKIKIKPICYDDKVYLGALKGNRFTITIRNIDLTIKKTKEHLEKRNKELNGVFLNYYGEQRFGSSRPITHLMGKYLLTEDIKNAVKTYISYTNKNDTNEIKKNRENAFTDLETAKKRFPKSCVYELDMILHLIDNPGDFLGALRKIPRPLRKMFVSAYQSYIFNRALFELSNNNLIKNDTNVPVPGYLFESRIFSDDAEDMIENILKKEKIKPSMFKVQYMPEISSEGTKRKAYAKFKNFKIMDVTKDDLNNGKTKATIRFSLDKGAYATVFLRQFFNI